MQDFNPNQQQSELQGVGLSSIKKYTRVDVFSVVMGLSSWLAQFLRSSDIPPTSEFTFNDFLLALGVIGPALGAVFAIAALMFRIGVLWLAALGLLISGVPLVIQIHVMS